MTGHQRTCDPSDAVPLGPGNGNVDFFTYGACAQAGVDPAIFTSEEDDQQAVTAARAVCSSCPVRLPCRGYAYDANPYGVYAGETQTERAANLKLHARLAAGEHGHRRGGGGVRAPTACQLCYDPLGPHGPRRLGLAQVRLSAQDHCRSGGRAPSPGGADLAANQSRVAG